MSIIEDGQGSGKKAGVSDENLLRTLAITESIETHTNRTEQEYYTLTINTTAGTAGNCIGYIKNSNTLNLNIKSFYLFSTTPTLLTIIVQDIGTPNNPTIIVPTNCNTGSENEAQGTFYQGSNLGNSGTALTRGITVLNWYVDGVNGKLLDFPPGIIISQNKTCTFYINQSTTAAIVGLGFFYHD